MPHSKEEILRRGWQPRETQHSMKRRKPWHNYHMKGTYMLTLVVEGRRPLLGRLVTNRCADAQGVGANAQGVGANAQGVGADAQGVGAKAQGVGAKAQGVGAARVPLFEEGYNDLILLEEGQLENWKAYLDDNPRRLAVKRLHPDFFTTLNFRDIAEWKRCQLVGNCFLLDVPQKVAVIVHRSYSDREFAEYRERWIACGEAGGILVSAAIAPREKEVMREGMDRGYRVILVRENGFPPLYKPAGEAFDACSEGRLLQVGPWEYHMERRRISREQCLMLNRLVETIAGMP